MDLLVKAARCHHSSRYRNFHNHTSDPSPNASEEEVAREPDGLGIFLDKEVKEMIGFECNETRFEVLNTD